MKPSTTRAQEFRKRQTEQGLKEVRGIWAKPEDHKKIKEAARQENNMTDEQLETAFADEIGASDYQRLLDEKWLPFQGDSHSNRTFNEAVKKEVQAAREFLASL